MRLRIIPLLLITVVEVSLVILITESLDAALVRIIDDHPGERLLQGIRLVHGEGTKRPPLEDDGRLRGEA